MLRALIPFCLFLAGMGGGIAAGLALRPDVTADPPSGDAATGGPGATADAAPPASFQDRGGPGSRQEYVRLNSQFVVPVVRRDMIGALVAMSLSLEVATGQSQLIYTKEPKLRDAFLQVLFDHANTGGFEGDFTSATNMDRLRRALTEVAQRILGDAVSGVLITEIARQDG